MSDVIDVALKVTDLELHNEYLPISRVTIWYDDENAFTAGDDTGRTLEIDCPWATQTMANDVLAQVRGYTYTPYSATEASLDPSFELGDRIEIGSLYSIIANATLGFNGLSQVEAPGEDEINHEYPYLSSAQREMGRTVKLGQQYYGTRITRKEGLVIEKTDGETVTAKAVLNADEFSFYAGSSKVLYFDPVNNVYRFEGELNVGNNFIVDKSGNIVSKGSASFGGDTIISGNLEITGNLAIPNGSISFESFNSQLQNDFNDIDSNASQALKDAADAWDHADGAWDKATAVGLGLEQIANGQYQGGTFIDGTNIYAPNLYGDTINLLDGNSYKVGEISLQRSATWGVQIESSGNTSMRLLSGFNFYAAAGGNAAWLQMKATGEMTLSCAGLIISDDNFGNSLPRSGVYGQVFFLLE